MPDFDITILTESQFVDPVTLSPFVKNVLKEDELVRTALEKRGLKVYRTHWDDERMNWSDTRHILFRSTWDYFNRFAEFDPWLNFPIRGYTFLPPAFSKKAISHP